MLARFLPKQKNFFVFFCQAADKLYQATRVFRALLDDLPQVVQHAKKITDLEHEGDAVALLSYQLLHKTFITPFDRHDIHTLTTQLDDTLDRLNHLAQRFVIYHFQNLPSEFFRLVDVAVFVTAKVREVVGKLESLANQEAIVQICIDIDQLENDAESILLIGIDQLFSTENDAKQLIKLKEIYEEMKLVINACQDIANLVKSIVLEYA